MTLFRAIIAVAALPVLLLSACEEERRVPYIPPDLHNWPEPYRGIDGLAVHVFVTGFIQLPAAMVLSGGSTTRNRALPSIVFLIVHPKRGLVLFNTGLGGAAGEDDDSARGFFDFLQPQIDPGVPLVEQMKAAGFDADKVRTIVLSSLRVSHLGGVDAFPKARLVVGEAEVDHTRRHTPDVVAELQADHEIEPVGFDAATPLGTFTAHEDLFGDGSCLLIDARGASAGTLAMLVRLPERPLLLAAELAPLPETVRYAARPAQLEDADAWWQNIWRLKRFADLAPELLVVPGRHLGSLEEAKLKAVTVYDYDVPPTPVPATPTPSGWKRQLPLPM